jgi:hypothetical protein
VLQDCIVFAGVREAMKPITRWLAIIAIVGLLVVYVATYAVMSRRGYAEAKAYELPCFYYFPPEDSNEWRQKEWFCRRIFAPLNWIDCKIGPGMHPGAEPLWGLSR